MRVIKFRAWQTNVGDYDKITKKFTPRPHYFYGENVIINGDGQLLSVESGWDIQGVEEPTDYVLEQATGSKDKNGKEIWEGDIVSVYEGRYVGYIVQHPSGEWRIIWVSPQGVPDSLYSHRTICEVVGNIHENPELLNGGKLNEKE